MSPAKTAYHHGDLRSALVNAALELLEEGGETALSLRAVARRAGVSAAAPYRHYEDREALVSAVAAVGYRELAERLGAAHPAPSTPEQLADVAVAYVQFALERPSLFRIMFGEPCNRDNDERVVATEAVTLYLREIVARCFPQSNPEALAPAIWALVHGFAFLFLDGKLDAPSPSAVANRVTAAIQALLSATIHGGRSAEN
ncbi:MAG TPA: TetR/AcrR family transcriptional regulator [Solirubrobacterales bacterium]|jgi:AcrR family transcriptional regulator|nr:TetR/AcrR family transcriptional regulator [Solirubrobacterales bacterium]